MVCTHSESTRVLLMTEQKYTCQQLSDLLGSDCAEGLLSARPNQTLEDKCAELTRSVESFRGDIIHLPSLDPETQPLFFSMVMEKYHYPQILKQLLAFKGMSQFEFESGFSEKANCMREASDALLRHLEELAKSELHLGKFVVLMSKS